MTDWEIELIVRKNGEDYRSDISCGSKAVDTLYILVNDVQRDLEEADDE